MLILSAKDQEKLIDMKEVLEHVSIALKEFAANKTDTPIRLALPFGEANTGLVMPSVAEGLDTMGLKYVTVVPKNKEVGKKTINGVVFLSDTETGEPLALLEGSYLTQIRTGALSGVATDHLARKDAKVLGIIGTGEQSKGLCDAVFAVRDIEKIYVFNRSVDKAEAFAEYALEKFGKEVIVCSDSNEVVRQADVLVTSTNALEPVFSEALKPGIHVNAVGSFRPVMQELPSSALTTAHKVVVEAIDAAMEETGDLQFPIKEGVFSEEDIYGELGKIVNGEVKGRESDEEITVFKSVGLAIVDIVVAKYLYDKAVKNNIGVQVDL